MVLEVFLAHLARGVPRRGVGGRRGDHLVVVDLDDALVARVHELGVVDHVVDHEPVVVAGAMYIWYGLPSRRSSARSSHSCTRLNTRLLNRASILAGSAARVVELLARLVDPVVAGVLDDLLDVGELFLVVDVAVLPHEGAFPLVAALLDERHEHLAGEVTDEHGHVDAVDRKRVEELAIAHVRAVDVGDEEKLVHLHSPEASEGRERMPPPLTVPLLTQAATRRTSSRRRRPRLAALLPEQVPDDTRDPRDGDEDAPCWW